MKKEIIIALTALLAIGLLFFGMQFLKGKQLFSNDVTYKIRFSDISGLTTTSPIYVNGFKVGVVKGIHYDYAHPDNIDVEVGISKEMSIPEGTTAEITSDLLGNVQVALQLGDLRERHLPEGGTIQGVINSGMMGEIATMMPTIKQMVPKLDSIMASLNTILADPAIPTSLHNIRQVTSDLTVSTRQLNALLADVNGRLPGIMDKASGTITRADNTLATANTMMTTINNKVGAVDVEATMAKVDQTLTNMQQLTEKMNSRENTLGLLMNDKTLYNNLSGAAGSFDSLMTNIKAHPKRYVHFSVFGKKD